MNILLYNSAVYRVWCVRYNPVHDQLVLSSSSDSQVVLCDIMSLSSGPTHLDLLSDDDEHNDMASGTNT